MTSLMSDNEQKKNPNHERTHSEVSLNHNYIHISSNNKIINEQNKTNHERIHSEVSYNYNYIYILTNLEI